jgi:hypothetical protein
VPQARGRRVLVVELDGKPALAELIPDIEVPPSRLPVALDEYLREHGFARIAKRLNRTGVIDVVGTAAPGIDDIVVLGKIKQLERSGEYDLIVVDGPAAGHAITFLTSAAGLADAVRGPVRYGAQADDVLATAPRPRAMPGGTGHVAGDDPGQRVGRDRLRPRGTGRRAPRSDRGEPVDLGEPDVDESESAVADLDDATADAADRGGVPPERSAGMAAELAVCRANCPCPGDAPAPDPVAGLTAADIDALAATARAGPGRREPP